MHRDALKELMADYREFVESKDFNEDEQADWEVRIFEATVENYLGPEFAYDLNRKLNE